MTYASAMTSKAPITGFLPGMPAPLLITDSPRQYYEQLGGRLMAIVTLPRLQPLENANVFASMPQRPRVVTLIFQDPTSCLYTTGSVAPSVLNASIRLPSSSPKVSRAATSLAASRHPANPATPDSPATIPSRASSRMDATAAASGIAMNAATLWSSSCQATTLGSPQASPAISVSRLPATAVGSPSSALANRHAARSGSTTISIGTGWNR